MSAPFRAGLITLAIVLALAAGAAAGFIAAFALGSTASIARGQAPRAAAPTLSAQAPAVVRSDSAGG